jgi:DNA-binding MarR family transcriptional regulator
MRTEKVKEKAQDIIKEGNKPSAKVLSDQLGYSEPDVHRCLNSLEKKGEIETYTKEVFGRRHRLIGVKR